jgi:5,10-methylenetetrahydromethanopterin reductase
LYGWTGELLPDDHRPEGRQSTRAVFNSAHASLTGVPSTLEPVRIGVSVNQGAGGRAASIDELVEQVAAFARRGFDKAVFANIFGVDALTVIALAGRVVPEIELETAVVPVYTRHPMAMAQQALTTQAAIGGRLTLGLGLSHRPVVENMWGLSFERPVEYIHEYLAILQPLLHGESADFTGKRFTSHTQLTHPETTPPSVVLAALGERMLRLAGEQTDGTATWMVGPKTLAAHVTPIITEAAHNAGRPAPRIIVGLPICVSNEVAAARARAARAFERYGQLPSYKAMLDREGVADPADVAVVGSESDVEQQLAEFERAGGTELNAGIFGSGDERQRTLEFLQTHVAHVRSTPV